MSSTFVNMDAAVEGITTILTSDKEAVPPSLHRNMSADMSSRKWMADNGIFTSQEEKSGEDIWKSIQEENRKKEEELHAPPQVDVWTSILEKKTDGGPEAPPYVHPLVKRSGNSLSKQSLEVCTESLGSETGSDGFSPSETGDVEDDAVEEEAETEQQQKAVVTSAYRRRDPLCRTRSFPPPLPSISKESGKSLYVRPRRDDGRLVLEAVSVTEQSNFRAHRQDGRLVLTFMEDPPTDELLEEENDVGSVIFGEDTVNGAPEPEPENEPEPETEDEEDEKLRSKISVLINKPVVLSNRNTTWSNKFSKVVLFGEEEKEAVHQSLPGLARVAPVSPYNVYEYFWRAKSSAIISPAPNHHKQTLIIKNFNNKYIVSKEPASNREEVVRGGGLRKPGRVHCSIDEEELQGNEVLGVSLHCRLLINKHCNHPSLLACLAKNKSENVAYNVSVV